MSAKQLTSIDIASYQQGNTAQLIAKYNPDHVIIRMYSPWERDGYQDISRAQVTTARSLGKSVGVYVWPYAERTPWETLTEAINLCHSCEPPVIAPIIWLDCENSVYGDGPDYGWLSGWRTACQQLQVPTGLYVRRSWIQDYFAGGEAAFSDFNDLPLWLADYDGIDDVDIFKHGLPQGWSSAAAKQWGVTSSIIGDVDRNVIRPEYTIAGGIIDPCATLREQMAALEIENGLLTEAIDKMKATAEAIKTLSEGIIDL